MRVLAAFDKFRDSVSAVTACDVAAGAIAAAHPGWGVDACPLADGGEGFAEVLSRAAAGTLTPFRATGPRGEPAEGAIGIVSVDRIPKAVLQSLPGLSGPGGALAVIEMATVSGLGLLPEGLRDPLRASSIGTGQLIAAAAGCGVRALLLGVGGSATHDLGLGALGALGVGFLNRDGEPMPGTVPADWPAIARIEGGVPATLPPIYIACDVDNPLLGPRGALAIYGPQKGLRPAEASGLEEQSGRLASLLCAHFGRPHDLVSRPGAGAAGGTAFGLMAGAGAVLVPGFEIVSAWLGLDARLCDADIVVTGEGRFDDSSLNGKGPGTLVRRALELGKPVHVFAGRVSLSRGLPGLTTHAITPDSMPLGEALARAPALLFEAVRRAFR